MHASGMFFFLSAHQSSACGITVIGYSSHIDLYAFQQLENGRFNNDMLFIVVMTLMTIYV